MPKLSDTMTEGVVAEWLKKVGDEVSSGEILAEIESDKATMEFESFYDGVLLHIGVEKGKAAPVDAILAIIGDKGEDVSAILKEAEAKAAKTEEPKEKKEEKVEVKPSEVVESKPQPKPAAVLTSKPAPVPQLSANGRVKASPLAKRLAKERGFDIGRIPGSGDGGRVVKRDVEAFNGFGPSAASAVESYRDEEVSQMQKDHCSKIG